ncbi:glycosyltransferase family 4 protein [uncultured Bacteroides sp.]|uniref:glycosyltransferase family 4 protein n=1 Tax=uncultured Bacteroides sp. TaxID=162156 RepID=UPI002AA65E75|nr:glycosyltransferase family 4 protein [uncultured Bacteroides sp.]
MKKVIFCTNLPSPYRVDFFNELGMYCDLIVLYERHSSSERNAAWRGTEAENFEEVYLDLKLIGVDCSKGSALKDYIKGHQSDVLIFTNYVSPATMKAILWCRLHGRKYYVEYDGGFNKKDSFIKALLKKLLLKGAIGHLTTADEHIKYLLSLDIPQEKIHKYPFTSVKAQDIANAQEALQEGKEYYRNKLVIPEDKVVLAVGQFIPRKGFDILMSAAQNLDKSIGIYIIGGTPTNEYISLKERLKLDNVHFIGFKTKAELAEYYLAGDVLAHPTREDIWGLVVNEAMGFGLPVVSSDRCIAALEMIEQGVNGYIYKNEDVKGLTEALVHSLNISSSSECFSRTEEYTIESMVNVHRNILSL